MIKPPIQFGIGKLTGEYWNPNTSSGNIDNGYGLLHFANSCKIVSWDGTVEGLSGTGYASIGKISGLWYWECKVINVLYGIPSIGIGQVGMDLIPIDGPLFGNDKYSWYVDSNGGLNHNGGYVFGWGSSYSNNSVLGIALDMNNGFAYFGIVSSGSTIWQHDGNPLSGTAGVIGAFASGLTATTFPAWGVYAGSIGTIISYFYPEQLTGTIPIGYNAGIY